MANFASALFALVAPAAKQVLASIGLGVITYAGLSTALGAINTLIQNNLNGIIPSVAALLGLAGAGQALGILSGAVAYRIGLVVTKRIGVLTT
ncbi:DUF2523 family protein [Pseudogulbenkiania sp. MAI-1]|uniref:DUF2523 family protein n=1 Tax=Pseudogulbenkiania sp. MAI-1 TaxID=990370 RepID=UPI00045EB058|nr:DUF2523 family protein [Pseudogulbenkiania sp. MAI-1]